jgi:hypothetical protein
VDEDGGGGGGEDNNNIKSGGDEDIEEDEEDEENSDEDSDEEDDDDEEDEEEEEDVEEDNESDESCKNLPRYKTQDFARWANGYDDNDSFIDNTEALEERLPSNKMPKHGKFYVNKDQKIQLVKTKPNPKKSDDDDDSNNFVPKKSGRKF